MRRLALLAALGALLALPAATRAEDPLSPGQIGRRAFTYGFPLLEFLRVRATSTSVRCDDGKGHAPVNAFAHARRFAGPQDRTVVAPNVDTLYSLAHVDLARGPVILTHPDMGRRFFDFEFVDPWTNVVGYVGTRTTGQRAGRFALTWTKGPARARRRVTGTRVIRSAYRRLWVIGRTLASTKADRRAAYRLMRRDRLYVAGHAPTGAPCAHPGRVKQARTPTGVAFLAALGRAMKENPPPKRDRAIVAELAGAGIGPGHRPTNPALGAGVDAAAKALPAASRVSVLQQALAHGGWVTVNGKLGRYGTDYDLRATIASVGLGANTPEEALYPIALADPSGALLTGARRYRLVFAKGTLPPARAFWSLTMYDLDGFLVPNATRRYAIGPTHPPFARRADGSVVVVVQRTRPTEPHVNWLPAPAGAFRLNLRLYWPRRAALTGAWLPPPVTPVG